MKYKKLRLCPNYKAEKLDTFHRHISESAKLYTKWEELGKPHENFTTWTRTDNQCVVPIHEQVQYYDSEELQRLRVYSEDGKLFHRLREIPALNILSSLTPLEERNSKVDKNATITYAIVIPDSSYQLYAIKMNTKGAAGDGYRIHHSSVSAGEDVIFAAEATISKGKFYSISDESGHYKPTLYEFVYGLNFMQVSDFDLSESHVKVTRCISGGRGSDRVRYDSTTKFLELYREKGFDSPSYCGVEQPSKETAQEHFNENIQLNRAIYFVKNENELYEFNRKPCGTITVMSFTDKYNSQQVLSNIVNFAHQEEEEFVPRKRARKLEF